LHGYSFRYLGYHLFFCLLSVSRKNNLFRYDTPSMIQVKVSQHLSIQHIFILPADKIDVYWYLVISSTNNKLHSDAEDMPTITTVYVPVIKSVSTQVFWKWARVARVASDCRLRRNCAATLASLSLPLHYLAVARCRKSSRPQGRRRRGVPPLFLDLRPPLLGRG